MRFKGTINWNKYQSKTKKIKCKNRYLDFFTQRVNILFVLPLIMNMVEKVIIFHIILSSNCGNRRI